MCCHGPAALVDISDALGVGKKGQLLHGLVVPRRSQLAHHLPQKTPYCCPSFCGLGQQLFLGLHRVLLTCGRLTFLFDLRSFASALELPQGTGHNLEIKLKEEWQHHSVPLRQGRRHLCLHPPWIRFSLRGWLHFLPDSSLDCGEISQFGRLPSNSGYVQEVGTIHTKG
jgi:hypothetical protein